MISTAQLQMSCAETLSRWDRLVGRAAELPVNQRESFADVSVQTGIVEKIARLREICDDPMRALEMMPSPEAILSEIATDLTVLEEAVDISGRLGLPIRNATLATVENEADRISAVERERIRATTVQAVVPTILSVLGGIVTSLIVSAIQGSGSEAMILQEVA